MQLPLRFPEEPESAALGGALQAAAVCAGVPVAEYVAANEPQCEAEVRVGQLFTSHHPRNLHAFHSLVYGCSNVLASKFVKVGGISIQGRW